MLERRAMTLFACWYHSYRKQQVNVIISGRSFGCVVLSSISENPLTLLKYFCSHHAHPTPSSGEGQEQLQWSQWKCSRKLGRITENMAWHTQEKVTPFTTPVQFPCCTTDEKLKETQILRLQVFILLLLTFLCIFFFMADGTVNTVNIFVFIFYIIYLMHWRSPRTPISHTGLVALGLTGLKSTQPIS